MFPNEIVDCLHLVGNRTNNPYGFRLRLFCVWLLWPSCVFGVYLRKYLTEEDDPRANDKEFVNGRADAAAAEYETRRLEGLSVEQAQESAMKVLTRGF